MRKIAMPHLKLTDLICRAGLGALLAAAAVPALAVNGNTATASPSTQPAKAEAAADGAATPKVRERTVCTRMAPLTGSLTPKKVCRKVSEPEKTQQ
jgi:hypothetical protein